MGHENGGWMNEDQRDSMKDAALRKEAYDSVEPAHERVVTEAEHIEGWLKYLESLHKLRQESGIMVAMLRDGRAKGFMQAFQQILRWCDRSGEEPEGQCLHEIDQICRKQLGLELLVVSRELTPAEHTEERIKNATEGAVDAYDE